jgi:hypothetical protein
MQGQLPADRDPVSTKTGCRPVFSLCLHDVFGFGIVSLALCPLSEFTSPPFPLKLRLASHLFKKALDGWKLILELQCYPCYN